VLPLGLALVVAQAAVAASGERDPDSSGVPDRSAAPAASVGAPSSSAAPTVTAGAASVALTPSSAPAASTAGASAQSGTPLESGSRAPARFVVIIGYDGGAPDPHPPLRYADDDAARLFLMMAPSSERAFLLSTFDAESAKRYPELTSVAREPTREQLAQVLGEVQWLVRAKKKEGRRTELFFAFAGHGDVNDAGEGFIVLADGPFTRTDLETQVIEPSPADTNHVVIDACSSYFMVPRGGNESGAKALTPAMLNALHGTSSLSAEAKARTGILVSTSGASEVHESSELEGGVFSFLLRSALAGAADENGDGRIEYVEAAAYISAASAGLDDPRARLTVHAEPPLQRPHVPLADISRSGATKFLKVDSGAAVHVRVIDSRGVPYAELHAAQGHAPVVLALPSSDPFFVVQNGAKEALLVPRAAGAYALSSLSFEDSPSPRQASEHLRGLFDQPYGPDVMRGFVGASEMPAPLADGKFDPPWAVTGTPPTHIPLATVGVITLGAAALVGLGAGAAVVGNELAFGQLQSSFTKTGVLDPNQSLAVEGWRTTATALTLGAFALGLAGGGLWAWSTTLPEGEVELR
jgi:hypothetical protein